MKRFLVHLLVFVAYYFVSMFAMNIVFYDLLKIQPTTVSWIVQIGIIFAFWFFFLRDRLFGPGGPLGPK